MIESTLLGKWARGRPRATWLDNVKTWMVLSWKKCLEQEKTEQSGGRAFMMEPTIEISTKVERQTRQMQL